MLLCDGCKKPQDLLDKPHYKISVRSAVNDAPLMVESLDLCEKRLTTFNDLVKDTVNGFKAAINQAR